jgi:hypothetical protein
MIKENLNQYDCARKFCAYCGLKENSNSEDDDNKSKFILGRCYGCQMVYYCNQEHQHLDWLENHMPKCAELEWVALGELIQSIPINLPLTNLSMTWPDGCLVNTWTDWFDIRPDLVNSIHEIAKTLENKLELVSKTRNSTTPTIPKNLPVSFLSTSLVAIDLMHTT